MTERIVSDKTHIVVFITLLVLTLGTYEIAKLNLGHWNSAVSMAIAATKAILVILYFMHLRHSSWLVRVAFVAGLFWFSILLALTMNDYLTRGW
jgi:cytochrome c oxidase subunit 4